MYSNNTNVSSALALATLLSSGKQPGATATGLTLPSTHQLTPGVVLPTSSEATIYVADLPLTTTYMDLVDCFERDFGSCEIVIKRSLFKNFHFAYVCFKDPANGKFSPHLNMGMIKDFRRLSLTFEYHYSQESSHHDEVP
jgi:hypothetical protein